MYNILFVVNWNDRIKIKYFSFTNVQFPYLSLAVMEKLAEGSLGGRLIWSPAQEMWDWVQYLR